MEKKLEKQPKRKKRVGWNMASGTCRASLAVFSMGIFLSCSVFNITSPNKTDITEKGDVAEIIIKDLMKSDAVYAYELVPHDTMTNKRVCNYAVYKEYKLGKDVRAIIRFIFSDSTLYTSNYMLPKQPFYPTFALTSRRESKQSCIVSFGTEEIAFSDNDSTYIAYKLTNPYLMRRLKEKVINENK